MYFILKRLEISKMKKDVRLEELASLLAGNDADTNFDEIGQLSDLRPKFEKNDYIIYDDYNPQSLTIRDGSFIYEIRTNIFKTKLEQHLSSRLIKKMIHTEY